MAVTLHVDAERWRAHLRRTVDAAPGLVPVIKGNGYGFGRDRLAGEATALDRDTIAVGTYAEVPDALDAFDGDVQVLTPYRPFDDDVVLDPRVVHTVGRIDDLDPLAKADPTARVLVEGETSMSRHGFDRHELAAVAAALGTLRIEGFALHLPLSPAVQPGANLAEAQRWAGVLKTSQLETSTLFVSHLSSAESATLAETRPDLTVRPRVGTALWLGDLGALQVRATVLDRHSVGRGERVGYRQRPVPRDGTILVVSGGTSHGIGLEAPRPVSGVVQRGKTAALGGLEAVGLSRSPFTIEGKQRWFVEPPHMHVSLVFLPDGPAIPAVGETVPVAVRYTTTDVDQVSFD